MRIAWVLGWAVPEAWFAPIVQAALPRSEHVFFAASPTWLAEVSAAGPWDAIAGHSLGTLLLLQEAAAVNRLTPRVALLSPVLAFAPEEQLGGRIPRTQIKFLSRWLKGDCAAALTDFYARAGLIGCEAGEASPELLQWGLERLARDRVNPPLPAGWRAYVGTNDELLDVEALVGHDSTVIRVSGATHHPEALIRAWSESLV